MFLLGIIFFIKEVEIMANEVAFREEYVYIEYDDIIRSYVPTLYNHIMKPEVKDKLKEYIAYRYIENLSEKRINWLTLCRKDYNILKTISKSTAKIDDFTYNMILAQLFSDIGNIYAECKPMMMVDSLNRMLDEKFTKALYVHVPSGPEEEWCRLDVCNLFKNHLNKVSFVSSVSKELIDELSANPTLYVVNDISKVYTITDNIEAKDYTNILLGNYGYNYILPDGHRVASIKGYSDDKADEFKSKGYELSTYFPILSNNIDTTPIFK